MRFYVRNKGTRGAGPWAWLAVMCVWVFATPFAYAQKAVPDKAIRSDLAAERLLVHGTRAGKRLVAVGIHGHIVLSDDGGRTWRQAQSVPTRALLTSVAFANPKDGWAAGHDSVILCTKDGGETWELQYSDPEQEVDTPILSIHFSDAENGLAVGAFSTVLATSDGGATWTKRALIEDSDDDFHLNGIFTGTGRTLFIAAEAGRIYRSRDGGETFQVIETGYDGSFWGGLSLDDAVSIVFGMRGTVFRSADGGRSWKSVETGTKQSLTGGALLRDGSVLLVGLGGTMARSADKGLSFRTSVRADRRVLTFPLVTPERVIGLGEDGVAFHSPMP